MAPGYLLVRVVGFMHRLELDANRGDVVAVVALLLAPLGRGRLNQLRHLRSCVILLEALIRLKRGRVEAVAAQGTEEFGAATSLVWSTSFGWEGGGAGADRREADAAGGGPTVLRILQAWSLSMNSQTPSEAMMIWSSFVTSMSNVEI